MSLEQAISDYMGARFRAETESMRQAQGDDNANIVGCARGERDRKFDAVIAAARSESQTANCLRGYAMALVDVIAALYSADAKGGEDDAAHDGLNAAIFVIRQMRPPSEVR